MRNLSYVILAAAFLLGTSVVSARFDCKKMISKFERCGASHKFTDSYEVVCREGDELSSADITTIIKSHEREMEHNDCISRVYREPRFDREERKESIKELREWQKEQRDIRKEEREDLKESEDD